MPPKSDPPAPPPRIGRGFYRRTRSLVCYWSHGQFLVHDYRSGRSVGVNLQAAEVLTFFDDWRSIAELTVAWPRYDAASLRRAVGALARRGLLQAGSARLRRPATEAAGWDNWDPEAGFFHFSTKQAYEKTTDADVALELAHRAMLATSAPPAAKPPGARRVVALSKPPADGTFADVLLRRRTWRRFGAGSLTRDQLGTLLWLTWGEQLQARDRAGNEFILRTSPSGGALNPIEAYPLVLGAGPTPQGVYHYAPRTHALARIAPASRPLVRELLASQWWFQSAALVVLMTVRFDRVQWRYRFPRAYRSVLIEAGHFAQTFCLVATSLGLAPFCTGAFVDKKIEALLQIDGVTESVVYAVGVGLRPAEGEDGRWPDERKAPSRAPGLGPRRRTRRR